MGKFEHAFQYAAFTYFNIDSIFFPSQYHPLRVVHAWRLCRLALQVGAQRAERGAERGAKPSSEQEVDDNKDNNNNNTNTLMKFHTPNNPSPDPHPLHLIPPTIDLKLIIRNLLSEIIRTVDRSLGSESRFAETVRRAERDVLLSEPGLGYQSSKDEERTATEQKEMMRCLREWCFGVLA